MSRWRSRGRGPTSPNAPPSSDRLEAPARQTAVEAARQTPVLWFSSHESHQALRFLALTLYYLGIIAGLILLNGRGDFSTPSFVYQGF